MQPTRSTRIQSVDILRGIVMIIMAIDHTRDYFHLPAAFADPLDPNSTSIAIYLTRWITHFCAPTFVLLSGVSAYLSSRRKTPGEASAFLIKRGLWLIVVEIVIVTFGITGNPFYNFIVLQVIWAIGSSMVLLGLLCMFRLSYKTILAIGLVLFFGHDLIFYASLPRTGALANILNLFLTARFAIIPLNQTHVIADLYAILPWTGVMLVGYGLGHWFDKEYAAEKRRRQLIITGFSLTVLFFALRLINHYGDPAGWQKMDTPLKTMFSFFRVSKYPPSLMYLCATLGPSTLALALLERARGKWTAIPTVYGRVPFFYYILHFYLLHIILAVFFFATGHTTAQILSPNAFAFQAPGLGYSLVVVYIIWFSVVAALYLPCRWFSRYKMEHRQWWLSYL
jgi:uncharacterized membrane protein